jgi:hypothetical protein
MEFFSKRIYTPDDGLLSMLTALGAQIGSFVERERMADQLALYTGQKQESAEGASPLAPSL